jgi:hypothetical protein
MNSTSKVRKIAFVGDHLPRKCGIVGSEVARSVARVLATVRRSNGVCSFPAPRFHEEPRWREAREGVNQRRLTSPYSP